MTVHKELGDALEAERIAARTRKFGRIRVEQGSGPHRIQATTLTGYAYCVIEKPLRGVRDRKRP